MKGRPFIGRKGIGKLALLSCAEKVTVISRQEGEEWIGGVIDNSELDKAITDDRTADEYQLGEPNADLAGAYAGLEHGTVIRFDGLKEKSKSSQEFLGKTIALYFRFSLLDEDFVIFLNDKEITHKYLGDLVEKTQFLWKIGNIDDPLIGAIEEHFQKSNKHRSRKLQLKGIRGFVASVEKPTNLKIRTTEERVGVDLFVNGRLREKDILKHIPQARIAESYLYGQVHFDSLDGKLDRFTSSREGIIADDPLFASFLEVFRDALKKIIDEWDRWRIEIREDGDPENTRLTKTQRASRSLYSSLAEKYVSPKKGKAVDQVEKWIGALAADAEHNYEAYADCFLAENLIREHIRHNKIQLSKQAEKTIADWKTKEIENLGVANISISIHNGVDDLPYLAMDDLAYLVDNVKGDHKKPGLSKDAVDFKPLRNAVAHTSLLTTEAKSRLRTVRENIAARLKHLLKQP